MYSYDFNTVNNVKHFFIFDAYRSCFAIFASHFQQRSFVTLKKKKSHKISVLFVGGNKPLQDNKTDEPFIVTSEYICFQNRVGCRYKSF